MREDLRAAADALSESVVVSGVGECADVLSTRAFPGARFVRFADLADGTSSSTAAVVVAIDPSERGDLDARLAPLEDVDAFTVALLPARTCGPETVPTVERHVDATLLVASDGEEWADPDGRLDAAESTGSSGASGSVDVLDGAIREFLAVVQAPGFVNLDLTDARTVLSSGVAALGTGTARSDEPSVAVEAAFDRLPAGVDVGEASAVLVDVVVGPETSIAAATDAIAAVRERVVADANVIWGGAVEESIDDAIRTRIVVADVRYAPRLAAGDPCPRCGSALSTYALGGSETLACDDCGYSGIGIRRE